MSINYEKDNNTGNVSLGIMTAEHEDATCTRRDVSEANRKDESPESGACTQSDGRAAARAFALLDELGIEYETVFHPAIFSAADREEKELDVGAMIFKNLFLRNKDKSRYYLYSLPIDKRANLGALGRLLDETRLSFGSAEDLWDILHITPGSVSMLNVIDAPRPLTVILLIDKEIFATDRFGIHPNDNTATVLLTPDGIERVLGHLGVSYRFVAPGQN